MSEEFVAQYNALAAENRRLRQKLGRIAEISIAAILICGEDAAEESKSVTGTEPREGTTTT